MDHPRLERELGLGGAVVTGLGSILGTGAFVSIGVASSVWGDLVLLAIPAAGLVAIMSGLSTAFLGARFPVAGGSYEYAYQVLNPLLGFSAGWLFLLAKTASAAAAALGIALGLSLTPVVAPVLIVSAVSGLVLAGVRRTAKANLVLVALSIGGIIWFFAAAVASEPMAIQGWTGWSAPMPGPTLGSVAFLFVAYTGYGRVATLAEEVRDPVRVIPLAVVTTLLVAGVLYMMIALGGRLLAGPFWGQFITLPTFGAPLVRIAAIAAMFAVMVNLILGLSRVWLAMGRRGDMPIRLSQLDANLQPRVAILVTGATVGAVTLIGDIGIAWSFSAMTVLLYYAITNLAVLAIDRTRLTAWAGLASCLVLSVFVPPSVWLLGAGLIAVGLAWKSWARHRP